MYLHDTLTDKDGAAYTMAGVIKGEAFPTSRLQRFGYITMNTDHDNMLCKAGENIAAHEFHYWDSTNCGNAFNAEKTDGKAWKCCHISDNLYAGFPHIYFYSNVKTAECFIRKCIEYGEKNGQSKKNSSN